jgi:hypothetical protein
MPGKSKMGKTYGLDAKKFKKTTGVTPKKAEKDFKKMIDKKKAK